MRIDHQARTYVGRRENNEDALLVLPERGLFAVADGMGGYEGGEIASRLALASLRTYFEMLGPEGLGLADAEVAHERMALAIRIAHRDVERRAEGALAQMGTTLASLVIENGVAMIAHVGDSRVYRLRDGEIMPLTRDHSLVAEMEAAGLVGIHRSAFTLGNVITQALGQGPEVRPGLLVEEVLAGDRFLLCSDGLTDVLDDEAIAWTLTRNDDVAEALVDAAYDHDSSDNITAIVVTAFED